MPALTTDIERSKTTVRSNVGFCPDTISANIVGNKTQLCRTTSTFLVLLTLCFSTPVFAQEPTFAKLKGMCSDAKDPLNYGFCVGFLEAVALRIVHENKNCTLLQEYVDHSNAKLALPDLIADLDPKEYSGSALKAVEKYFVNKGCT